MELRLVWRLGHTRLGLVGPANDHPGTPVRFAHMGHPEQGGAGALAQAQGPVVLVSNEVGLGVIPMGREVRAYVDALGRLNQQVAGVCQRVTLMAAGLPLALKSA